MDAHISGGQTDGQQLRTRLSASTRLLWKDITVSESNSSSGWIKAHTCLKKKQKAKSRVLFTYFGHLQTPSTCDASSRVWVSRDVEENPRVTARCSSAPTAFRERHYNTENKTTGTDRSQFGRWRGVFRDVSQFQHNQKVNIQMLLLSTHQQVKYRLDHSRLPVSHPRGFFPAEHFTRLNAQMSQGSWTQQQEASNGLSPVRPDPD